MIPEIAFCIFCGFANRARGSRLFDITGSTTIGRLVSMLLIAVGAALLSLDGNWVRFDIVLLWVFASLMLWCIPAWDSLWSAAIGHETSHSRLWGLAHLGLRMTLAAPCIAGLAYLTGHIGDACAALATPLLAVPYYMFGYLTPGSTVIRNSEFTAGIILGALICLSIV